MLRVGAGAGYCRRSRIYDAKHIETEGLNCPFRHSEYHWPATVANNHCIIGDSIVKFLKTTNQADVISFPGITIDRLYWKIKLGKVNLEQYKIIVIHVGTNDVKGNHLNVIVQKYLRLLEIVRYKNHSAGIGLSSVLPKPCETQVVNEKIILLNRDLKRISVTNNCHFIPSYRPFVGKQRQLNTELFAKDGLHLNFKGSVKLRNNLIGNIKSIQGHKN